VSSENRPHSNENRPHSDAHASASSGRRVYITAILATGQKAGRRYKACAKEVRFFGFRPDGDGERRADHGGERDEAHEVASRVKSEEFTVLQPRSI
jgi:hypothetical protein